MKHLILASMLLLAIGCTKEQQSQMQKTETELKKETKKAGEAIKNSDAGQKIKNGAKEAGQGVKKGAGELAQKTGKKLEQWGKKAQH